MAEAKPPAARAGGQVVEVWATSGGSRDGEMKELAAMPAGAPGRHGRPGGDRHDSGAEPAEDVPELALLHGLFVRAHGVGHTLCRTVRPGHVGQEPEPATESVTG
ncbi:hypothetical protein [Streptomyces sp. 142MFCol3.1]|uniref:hypothetical protein n=1 Tax=Streptomyces sp. 142MFCol3.1 TaxID=1172179 RepID=UPI0003F57B4B|nr:hypothetical protein [Streptomyces sp. 142MFCol3.1]